MFLTALLGQQPELPPLPAPQPYEAGATEHGFLWLGGCETGFGAPTAKLVGDDHRLSIVTRGIPMWFVFGSSALPLIGWFVFLVYVCVTDGDRLAIIGLVLMIVFSPLPILVFVKLIRFLNRKARDGVVRATLHRDTAMLELHDYSLALSHHSISELLLVRGRQRKKDNEGTDISCAKELSVVATSENGERLRWHVVTAAGKQIDRFADEVARTLGVAVTRCKAT